MHTLVKGAHIMGYIWKGTEDRQSQQSPTNGGFV
jgi:hypothetical protein